MIDYTTLVIFIPTFFFVSITPGMCMTLALTLGMSIGVKRTLWMMLGELIGVAAVAIAAVVGVASIMLKYPGVFAVVKYVGGAYLAYVGIQMWLSKGRMSLSSSQEPVNIGRLTLFNQGLFTAISNPKGWAFMVSLLPPFINTELAITPQLIVLVCVIMVSEFTCMMLYASGGKTLRIFLSKGDNVKLMNRIAGTLMAAVGVWLALS
ncbi:LysE family translocator [Colwellia hornerae]|uniref:LysE family translocator n=1 Tax=Colwellia hornerae TaxID=89402 RepID=A0A5C6Q8F8_9GAMM|nr:LysE family translocator [Colwellia hornerae]TWX57808.1 LysE family translocator [Colwellia hornerae]TWX62680.1 LysE family translocator [Colwellia hornerae]TWX65088.1 LysE family translocator [Colwellia hornerae]